ncbi:Alaserpin [Papilio machaon]|uniref:Alaserpin n=1 Tax=Papilio machaon TaxID=76193 RepID=A0A0N0PFN9_PAPMA|nr:Alaserpin [Papilio machaon]
MLIVLPNEINGLDGVLKKLADGYDLMAEVDNMFNTKVQVTIPKFKIETEIDLCDLLPKVKFYLVFIKYSNFFFSSIDRKIISFFCIFPNRLFQSNKFILSQFWLKCTQ